MSKNIQVLLLENVPSIGQAGDIVTVADGYARNFLFVQGKAALATGQAIAERKNKTAQSAKQAAAARAALQERAEQLNGTELLLTAEVKDGDLIYGKITTKMIAEELAAQTQLKLKPKDIALPEPLTRLGSVDVIINLGDDIETTIRVTVLPAADATPSA